MTHTIKHIFPVMIAAAGCLTVSCSEPRYPGPLAPEEALKSFTIQEGFEIELFAAEPFVMDPVEMVFDEHGNVYVVEMPDYPFKPEPGKGMGRIKVLQDTDEDGRVDNAIVFADSISEATSMLPWNGGLVVTAAPHILFLKDTNADFVADTKEILFSGFFDNNSEAQITSLRFGIDNWIYAANNGQAGQVKFHRKDETPPLRMNGADFRFRLDRGEFELESGTAQFGQTMDDWGNRFITQNTLHIRQVVIPWRYLHRHAYLPPASPLVNISDHDLEMYQQTPPPYWRAERTRRRQERYKQQNLDRVEYAEDHFTGCSGGTIYDGDAFPSEYYGNVFTGDVAGNLVHRDILVPSDSQPMFLARRHEREKSREFLTSNDPWFRPASLTTGPDGSLFVIDMYRQHIETPLSIPEDLKADMDFLAGSDRGRIYRIIPKGFAGRKTTAVLHDSPSSEWVTRLAHENRWWRLQAQRVLLQRQDAAVIPLVRELFRKHADARVRLHALYVLEGMHALDASLVYDAMKDVHPGVRKHGIMLAERYPALLPRLLESITDSSVQVVFQAALSAGQFEHPDVQTALVNLLTTHGGNQWFRTAILSSKIATSPEFLAALIRQKSFLANTQSWKTSLIEDLSFAIGSAGQRADVNTLLGMLSASPLNNETQWQMAGLNGLKKGLGQSDATDSTRRHTLETITVNNPGEIEEAIRTFRKIYITGS